MARVVVSALADADAAGIVIYLASVAGMALAVRYNSQFESLYTRLVDYPLSGALRPALGPGMRIGIVPPYIVIYRYEAAEDAVTILRIVHSRRKITGDLLGRKP